MPDDENNGVLVCDVNFDGERYNITVFLSGKTFELAVNNESNLNEILKLINSCNITH